jgi:methylthioxylose transferase
VTSGAVTGRALVIGCLGVLAAGVVLDSRGHALGTATPPLVMGFEPSVHPWAVAAGAACAAAVALAPRLPALALGPTALVLALTINAARLGTAGWTAVFSTSFEAANEYLPALPALAHGRGFLLDRFAELAPALPVHAAGHPPGLLVALDAAGLTTPGRMAALCIACAALVPPLTFALARAAGTRHARTAGLLALASPALLLFGTTSADAVYAALGTAAAALLVRREPVARGAGAALLALAAFASWALLAAGAWAAIFQWRRDGLRPAAAVAGACAVAVVAFNGALAAMAGYDPIGTLRSTEAVYRNSIAQIRPYWFWVAGSPAAFALMTGLPLLVLAARRPSPAAVATFTVIGFAAVAGFTKAETERIWLFLVPLLCVAAAEQLPARRVRAVLALLLAQALACQLLFYTVW